MKIQNLCHGGWASNCYYVTDDSGANAIVIDPSVPPQFAENIENAKLCAVLLTHTHYDHIMALDAWRQFGAPVLIAEADACGLGNSVYNASATLFGQAKTYPDAERLLKQGDIISFGDEQLKVILTPGHTPGSCCFSTDGILFSGDTLFSDGGIGRCDLPGGDIDDLIASLKTLLALPQETIVYPGHGSRTTIAVERQIHGLDDL